MTYRRSSCPTSSVPGLLLLCALGLALRLLVAQTLGDGLGAPLQGDEGDYLGVALRLLDGQGFVSPTGQPTAMHPPGFSLLLAGLVWLGGDGLVWLRVAMAALSTGIIPACFALTRTVTGSTRLAWTVAVVAVIFPTWVQASASLHTDMLTAVLVTTMAWLLLEGARRDSLGWLVGGGLCWSLAILTRAVCLAYAPLVLVWLLLLPCGWRAWGRSVVAVAWPVLMLVGPWTVLATHMHGQLVLVSTQSGTELFKGNNPDATGILADDHASFDAHLAQRYPIETYPNEAIRSARYQADALAFMRTQPGRFLQLCAMKFGQVWKLWSPRVSLFENLAILCSFGLLLPYALWRSLSQSWRDGPTLLLVGLIVCQTAAHMLYTANVRYRLPVEPLVVVLALAGMLDLWRRWAWVQDEEALLHVMPGREAA